MNRTAFFNILAAFFLVGEASAVNDHAPVMCVPDAGRKIALTFDDGPDLQTLEIIKLFKAVDGKATFFVTGSKVETHPKVVNTMVDEGFEVGNHGYTHKNLKEMGIEEIRAEIEKTQEIIKGVTGASPAVFRAPYLAMSDDVWNVLDEYELPAIHACIGSRDWVRETTAKMIVERVEKGLQPGAIVLMHSWSGPTMEALPEILTHVTEHGYELVTVSELISASKTAIREQSR